MRENKRHSSIIGIFSLFGVMALFPTSYFTGRFFAFRLDVTQKSPLIVEALASPSTFFALSMVLAGICVWKLSFLPRGMQSSFGRILCGMLLAAFVTLPDFYLFCNPSLPSVGSISGPTARGSSL